MVQEVKVIARTFEVDDTDTAQKRNLDLTILSGKAAGVCYMPDDYMEAGIQDEAKALARANQTAASGHHSVFDHGHITMIIKTNKMMAMILNSLGVYATSEKSARYTKMQPETKRELELYEKWRKKIQSLILTEYPDMDDSTLQTRLNKFISKIDGVYTTIVVKDSKLSNDCDKLIKDKFKELKLSETLPSYKLAQENARYMLSIFTPTTMEYTISFRQLFLTIDYLSNLIINCANSDDSFSRKLIQPAVELRDEFEKIAGEKRLTDNKNQYIRFLEGQHIGEMKDNQFVKFDNLSERFKSKKETFGDNYTDIYLGSLAMLAQAQRHRTIRYTMFLREPYGFYTPPIITVYDLQEEWLEDLYSIADCIPQATLVRITEQGIFEDFVLKCKERLCGRAQLEIMNNTLITMQGFIDNNDKLCYANKELLATVTKDSSLIDYIGDTSSWRIPCPRCQFKDFTCKEGCRWGTKALDRCI